MSNRQPLTLELITPTDDNRPVFVAGNFSNWYPDKTDFEMKRVGVGKYRLTLPPSVVQHTPIEYKYTRGNWDNTELDELGNRSRNRILTKSVGLQQDFVPYWRHDGYTATEEPLMPIVEEISDIEIPQMGKTRKAHVLLPASYYNNPTKTYPVLYMQDAQNLFGEGSAYGNWEIDKRLSLLTKQGFGDIIIVAIDHGHEDRFVEYSPYAHATKGKGQGMKYANFIVRNLKPTIDSRYRTKPETQFTGIGGSSMGGLISLYAGFMYPETFGRLMVFSPSLWVSPRIYFDAVEFFNPKNTRLYLYGGQKEATFMLPSLVKLQEALQSAEHPAHKLAITLSNDPLGEHNEKKWGEEFPKALEWLFFSEEQ